MDRDQIHHLPHANEKTRPQTKSYYHNYIDAATPTQWDTQSEHIVKNDTPESYYEPAWGYITNQPGATLT